MAITRFIMTEQYEMAMIQVDPSTLQTFWLAKPVILARKALVNPNYVQLFLKMSLLPISLDPIILILLAGFRWAYLSFLGRDAYISSDMSFSTATGIGVACLCLIVTFSSTNGGISSIVFYFRRVFPLTSFTARLLNHSM
jgi:hypothetical protein